MSPPDAPPPTPFARYAPSTTLEPCTDAPTLPALEVATLRLLLAVVLPRPRGAPIAEVPTLRLRGIVTPDRLRPLSDVQSLPKRSFLRRRLAMKWTRPPTIETSRPPPSPTRSLQSAFEMATPRARRTTILPATLRPAPGSGQLPPVEPQSPSPMSRSPSGLAR